MYHFRHHSAPPPAQPAWVLQHARTVFGITASIAVIILAIVAGIKGKKNGDAEGASRGCTA
eukprot:m.173818 g.173818  ORF g.173818 m.173818 type:complete len:61 (+) comp17878_c0_seq6:87-269(+)